MPRSCSNSPSFQNEDLPVMCCARISVTASAHTSYSLSVLHYTELNLNSFVNALFSE